VAPQLWAWGQWRIGKLRRCCDKLCCILPFEETWFKDRGIDTTFVSNPLFDNIASPVHDAVKTYDGFDPSHLKLALMPGSRTSEIQRLWQPMQRIALRLQAQYPHATITTVAVNNERRRILEHAHIQGFTCTYTVDSVRDTAAKADFALVASGSATLEVASAGCPMVAMYQSNWLLWHLLGWFLIKCPYFTLINLVADQGLIPEFMPYFTSIDPIVAKVTQMIETQGELARISRSLIKTIEPLTGRHTSDEVAAIVMDMLLSGQGPMQQQPA
jgi:lipid-A-disaccharide synthase